MNISRRTVIKMLQIRYNFVTIFAACAVLYSQRNGYR